MLATARVEDQNPHTMATTYESVFRTCGSECEYAEEIRGTFGEWYWCQNPAATVRIVRAMHECVLPRSTDRAASPPPVPSPGTIEEARRVS